MNISRSIIGAAALALLALVLLPTAARAQEDPHRNHRAAPGAAEPQREVERIVIPDVPVLDQEGRSLRFRADLVEGRVVAINFLFTNCTTICPPLGATFGKLRKLLGERAGRDVHLISVSVDPTVDTPARLKAWAAKFGEGPGWSLVTGTREDITKLLKALGAYTADKNDHPPLVLISNRGGQWTRAYGLASPAKLAAAIDEMAGRAAASALTPPASFSPRERGEKTVPMKSRFFSPASPSDSGGVGVVRAAFQPAPEERTPVAQRYFGDTVLLDQDGREQRFYTDLLKGRTVIMDFIYTRCVGPCPILSSTFAKIQNRLGDRLGSDVFLLSFSVDPDYDTPARLKEYAGRFRARPGWTFLTGSRQNVETVLRRLGQWVESPEQHQTLYILGNEATGLWKKAFGLAKPDDLFPVIDSVIDDRGRP